MHSMKIEKPIAILGAGPAGLMLGRLLDLSKIPFTIFERDTEPLNRQGSGTLDVHPGTGQLALKEAGLFPQFKELARFGVRNRLVDEKGKVLADVGGEGDEDRPEIDRLDLQRIIQETIPPGKIQWGSKVRDVGRNTNGAVEIHMADGKVESGFGLVVGADGAWSKVRNLFTSISPQYSGTTFLGTTILPGDEVYESADSLAARGNFLAIRGYQKIFLYYLGDRSYKIYVGSDLARNQKLDDALLSDPLEVWKSVFSSDFKEWSSTLTDLVSKSARGYGTWPFYHLPKEALSWDPVPGAALVGDAAHVTVPNGEGVNNAMFDSLELAQQIIKHWSGDLEQAVAEYEKTMIPRARGSLEDGEMMMKTLFGPDAPESLLQAFGFPVDGSGSRVD
ncbi:unnamed protein product [Zymoseptoria tritici ST99CH_3D7]|uniref:FAD-binding domain-containing protein n=1 Tax=Zymoseptoria tritici (strain ST99CH_3D7) TaxID=1276538 RepID=A0A1X7S7N2_ZYMT9|nr:unnamed protein product [Zymoseptoria tritici ST99CH_3D7]